MERKGSYEIKEYEVGERVRYRFYTGRLEILSGKYVEARKTMEEAFKETHSSQHFHKRLILLFLIPLKMNSGVLPSLQLLEKYQLLQQYSPFREAILEGDIGKWEEWMEKEGKEIRRRGLLLVMENVKSIVYRSLFSKLHSFLPKPQLKLDFFLQALHSIGIQMDMEELQCLLANLIYKGFIKGYLKYPENFIIFSKKDPFPSLNQVFGD